VERRLKDKDDAGAQSESACFVALPERLLQAEATTYAGEAIFRIVC